MGVTRSSSSFVARREDLREVGFAALSTEGFIGLRMLPGYDVDTQTGNFRFHTARTWMRNPPAATGRSDGRGAVERTQLELESGSFACGLRAREFDWTAFDKAQFANELDFEMAGITLKTLDIQREHEASVIAKLTDTGVFTGATNTLAVAVEWDKPTTCTPVEDVAVGKNAILQKSGQRANILCIAERTFQRLSTATQLRDTLGAKFNATMNDKGQLSTQQLALALSVPEVIVASHVVTGGPLWNEEFAFLGVVSSGPLVGPPSLGRTFAWKEYAGLLEVKQWEEKGGDLNVIKVEQCTEEKILNVTCGFLFSNIKT